MSRRPARVRRRRARGAGAGRRGDCAAIARRRKPGAPGHQQDRRQARAAQRGARVLRTGLRARVRGVGRAWRRRATNCSTRSGADARRRPASSAPSETLTRSPSRSSGRPNVGKSSLVNRLLRDERVMVSDDAGHDARHGGCRAAVAEAPVPHSRHGRHAAARHAWPRAGQVESVSVVLAKRAMARADVVVLVDRRRRRARPTRSAIAGEAERPAAASSSRSTSGT